MGCHLGASCACRRRCTLPLAGRRAALRLFTPASFSAIPASFANQRIVATVRCLAFLTLLCLPAKWGAARQQSARPADALWQELPLPPCRALSDVDFLPILFLLLQNGRHTAACGGVPRPAHLLKRPRHRDVLVLCLDAKLKCPEAPPSITMHLSTRVESALLLLLRLCCGICRALVLSRCCGVQINSQAIPRGTPPHLGWQPRRAGTPGGKPGKADRKASKELHLASVRPHTFSQAHILVSLPAC